MAEKDRARALRRRHQQERQAVVFGSLVAALAVLGLGAVAVYTGAIRAPFLDRGFVTPSSDVTASTLPPPPCPPDGAVPLAYDQVTVSVYNGSDRSGLAGTTADVFASRGFAIGTTANYPTAIDLPVEVLFGQSGVAAAYTVAAQLIGPRLVLDTREDATVDVVVGASFAGMVPADEVTLDPKHSAGRRQGVRGARGRDPRRRARPHPEPLGDTDGRRHRRRHRATVPAPADRRRTARQTSSSSAPAGTDAGLAGSSCVPRHRATPRMTW